MIKTFEYKLYLNKANTATLERWMHACAWVYNRALEHRIKAWERRKQSVSLYDQYKLLTHWKKRICFLKEVQVEFLRDALRRVDCGMKAFFRRCKAGEKPGFPRWKSGKKWSSMEALVSFQYAKHRNTWIQKIGWVKSRGRKLCEGAQKSMRVVRRASGWFASIMVDTLTTAPAKKEINKSVGVDMGLMTFLTTSDGNKVENPRFLKKAETKLKRLQRRLSRRTKFSKRWKKSVKAVKVAHEKVASQRKSYCHKITTELVRNNDFIAVEKLNVSGMSRSRFGKSILDVSWGIFFNQLRRKVEWTGATLVEVDPAYTSQTCPRCGAVKKKEIWERTHDCECGYCVDRDHAGAQIVLKRGLDFLMLVGKNARGDAPDVRAVCETGRFQPHKATYPSASSAV